MHQEVTLGVPAEPEVVKWRRLGDLLQGLVRIEIDGAVTTEWQTALPLAPLN